MTHHIDVSSTNTSPYEEIRYLHTLGPTGTNLEAASWQWLRTHDIEGEVSLHETLESALEKIPCNGQHAIVACAVYPDLHRLVFGNLQRLRMVDCFLSPTFNMVLASKNKQTPRSVSAHPAPAGLVPPGAETRIVTSNSQAAADCAAGITHGCITTSKAAEATGLHVIDDFGPVPMVFTIHQAKFLKKEGE